MQQPRKCITINVPKTFDVEVYILDAVVELYRVDRRVHAIKLVQKHLNCGLKEAKDLCDVYYDIQVTNNPF
jgi:ribosomal protein L7/L12